MFCFFLFWISNFNQAQIRIRNECFGKCSIKNEGVRIASRGFNTNGFIRFFDGMKDRPNVEDLNRAEESALNLKQKHNRKET